MNLKTLETLVNIGLSAGLPKFGKSEVSFDLISKSQIFKGKRKFNAEKKNLESFQKKRESQVRFFFQTGRRDFNIFITLSDYCRGSRNLLYIVINL